MISHNSPHKHAELSQVWRANKKTQRLLHMAQLWPRSGALISSVSRLFPTQACWAFPLRSVAVVIVSTCVWSSVPARIQGLSQMCRTSTEGSFLRVSSESLLCLCVICWFILYFHLFMWSNPRAFKNEKDSKWLCWYFRVKPHLVLVVICRH